MNEAVSLLTETEGVESACIWELDRDGRRLHLRAGLEGQVIGAGQRVSAARDSHAGAAVDSGLHVIVDDWSTERRYSMPPALRVLGVRSSLAVVIQGKKQPFGVLDIHSTMPSRFTPQDVHFVQASANVLTDAIERHTADAGAAPPGPARLAHRAPEPPQLRRLALGSADARRRRPARRWGSSSSTSTTSS